jgi:hypothetical protein
MMTDISTQLVLSHDPIEKADNNDVHCIFFFWFDKRSAMVVIARKQEYDTYFSAKKNWEVSYENYER